MEPENKIRYPSGRVARTLELRRQLTHLIQEQRDLIECNRGRTRKLIDGFEANESPNEEAIKEFKRASEEESRSFKKKSGENLDKIKSVTDELRVIRTEAGIEGTKLKVEAVKQQATFSAAAVAGVAAITAGGAMPTDARFLYLLWITYGILLATIVVSLFLMYAESRNVEYVLKTGGERNGNSLMAWLTRLLYLSVLGLPAAIVVFLVFVVRNIVG